MRGEQVLSTFDPIDTVVDNIKISEGLEKIAKIMDRCTLIRTYRVGDLGHILHTSINITGTPATLHPSL